LMGACPVCRCFVELNKHSKQECKNVNLFFYLLLLIYSYALYFQLKKTPRKLCVLYDDVPGGNGLTVTSLKRPGSYGAEYETDASVQVVSGDEEDQQVCMTVCITSC
jgi:hypothetical protein